MVKKMIVFGQKKVEKVTPKYEIQDNDPDNWTQGEEHDLTVKRLAPLTLNNPIVLDIVCEGGDITKGEQLTDDGSENWSDEVKVIPTSDKVIVGIDSEDIEIEDFEKEEVEEVEYNPNSEIWYRTSIDHNIPVSAYGFGATYLSNEYDPKDDCFKIKFDGDVTSIPGGTTSSGFMYGSTTLIEIIHLPSTIKTISGYFLTNCSNLQSVNLSGLSQVTSIGTYFLSNCRNLESIDLSLLSQVTSIGDNFLYNCQNLQTIDLSPLSQVTSIGQYFLSSCKGLQSIDLAPLSQVTSIGSYFLYSCSGLQSIDLNPLSQLKSIDSIFLMECRGLQSVNWSELSKVSSVGNNFLGSCIELQSVNLSGLSQLTSIGDNFLSNCSNLKTFIIDYPEGLITLPLTILPMSPNGIYVNDELLEEYKEAVSRLSSKFKPLSEYNPV